MLAAHTIRWYQPVVNAAREGWTAPWVAQLKGTNPLGIIRLRYADAERTRQLLAPHMTPELVVQLPTGASNASKPPARDPAAMATSRGTEVVTANGGSTLHAAWDAFVDAVQLQPVSDKHKDSIRHSIVALKHYQADVPLAAVDYGFLEQLTALLKSRPVSRKKRRRESTRERIKPYTVKRLLQHLRQATHWLHRQRESDRFGGWRAPADWQELFS